MGKQASRFLVGFQNVPKYFDTNFTCSLLVEMEHPKIIVVRTMCVTIGRGYASGFAYKVCLQKL